MNFLFNAERAKSSQSTLVMLYEHLKELAGEE